MVARDPTVNLTVAFGEGRERFTNKRANQNNRFLALYRYPVCNKQVIEYLKVERTSMQRQEGVEGPQAIGGEDSSKTVPIISATEENERRLKEQKLSRDRAIGEIKYSV